MMGLGLFLGISAAFFQSAGYLFSRMCIKEGMAPFQLLIRTQIIMGLGGLLLLPFVWRDGFWGNWSFVVPFLGCSFGSVIGQLFFYRAENHIAPSRVSSLMGLRVVILAIISALFGFESYNWIQVGGIVLAVCSAVVMNYQGGKIQLQGMGNMMLSLLFYAVSDLSVKHMIVGIHVDSLFHASLIAMSLVNILLATLSLPFIFKLSWRDYLPALPYSSAWFVKQFFLYGCYTTIGPVFGNIVMSARGPISIILTLILLHFGVKHLETPKGAVIWIRRGIATSMMIGAIAVYSLA